MGGVDGRHTSESATHLNLDNTTDAPTQTETLSSKGQHCFGAVGSNDVGKWAVQVRGHGSVCACAYMNACGRPGLPTYPNHHRLIPPQFYPNGDAKSGAGYCSIFVKNMVLAPGVAAVKIEGACVHMHVHGRLVADFDGR